MAKLDPFQNGFNKFVTIMDATQADLPKLRDHTGPILNSIDHWRQARELTWQELADRMGTSPRQIRRLANGERRLTAEWIARIADALEVKRSEIIDDLPHIANATPVSSMGLGEDDPHSEAIAVLDAHASTNCPGFFISKGEQIEIVARPPGVRGASGIYGIRLPVDTMDPEIRRGDLLMISRHRPATVGDSVAIMFKEEQAWEIGRLLSLTTDKITIQQHNPRDERTFARAEIECIHKVLSAAELSQEPTQISEQPLRPVPVYSAVRDRMMDHLKIDPEPHDHVAYPPAQFGVKGLFGIRTRTPTGDDHIFEGALHFIAPYRPVNLGDLVLAEALDDDGERVFYTGRLGKFQDGNPVIERYRIPSQTVIDRAKIVRIMRRLTTAELFGI